MDPNNVSLGVSIISSSLMIGAIFYGAGRLNQSVVGVQKGLDATNEKLSDALSSIDTKVADVQKAVAKLQGFNEGVQDERNRQGA